jgi:6-phosphogluconolactonase
MRLGRILSLVAAALAFGTPVLEAASQYLVYIGTYTNNAGSKGIYVYRFDPKTGNLEPGGLAAETANPSFLALHPNGRFLYAVSETSNFNGEKSGAVTAFSIDRGTGRLTPLNQVASRGTSPCHLRVDATGKMLVVANYGSGSTAAMPIHDDGSLGEAAGFVQHTGTGPIRQRQRGPHAHSANYSPDNRYAVVADLGIDKLLVFRIDPAKATLEAHDPPSFSVAPGSGPRHFTFHPNGRFGYVINEISSTVTALAWDRKRGAFSELQTHPTLPAEFKGQNSTAEVQVHPSGRFLYGSNRGHDSLAVFAIGGDGRLKPQGHVPTRGRTPRNFGIDPAGDWLIAANQNSNNLVVFRVDKKTGALKPNGQTVEVGAPVCVRFLEIK